MDWETDSTVVKTRRVKTRRSTIDIDVLTSKQVVITGCGQRIMFGGLTEEMDEMRLPEGPLLSQEAIIDLIDSIRIHDIIYKII